MTPNNPYKKQHERLFALEKELAKSNGTATVGNLGDHGGEGDIADLALQERAMEMIGRDHGAREAQREAVAIAIEKIADGTFGLCESCLAEGKAKGKSKIPKTRLNAIPYAVDCAPCKTKQEQRGDSAGNVNSGWRPHVAAEDNSGAISKEQARTFSSSIR